MQKLDGEVKAAIADIASMKPTVEAFAAAKLQAQGAVTAVRWTSRARLLARRDADARRRLSPRQLAQHQVTLR
ncbi:hypothetical protein [Bradyrhizobium zhanjiangense]|uniref:Uncharacterized protein n=1 Tax=Bradyrhizobium zhanjiangense TaxID=1325107 RepID=A0A4Q0QQ60_9BRAD|nr:hypothetical protein [Bradyrhizobium zhanjiangense]RXG97372.1 hypothetical protein EAS61_15380 [Bradyrhizobium zhanjiangense]